MNKYEIYDNLINSDNKLHDILSIESHIMILEKKLLYGLDSKQMQIVVDLKKEYEKLIK